MQINQEVFFMKSEKKSFCVLRDEDPDGKKLGEKFVVTNFMIIFAP